MKRWDKVGRKVSGESQWKDNFWPKVEFRKYWSIKAFEPELMHKEKI